jgi:hypothetical protein
MRLSCVVLVLLACACAESRAPCMASFASCESSGDCPTDATCDSLSWAYGSGDICLTPCETELDCPRTGGAGGRCLGVSGDGAFYCYRECAFTSDCPTGWVCQPIRNRATGARSSVCLP